MNFPFGLLKCPHDKLCKTSSVGGRRRGLPRQSDSARRSATKAAAKTGQTKTGRNQTDQAKIKPNLTLFKSKNVAAPFANSCPAVAARPENIGLPCRSLNSQLTQLSTIQLPSTLDATGNTHHASTTKCSLPAIASHCQPLPAIASLPAKQIFQAETLSNPQVIGQILQKPPPNAPKKTAKKLTNHVQ